MSLSTYFLASVLGGVVEGELSNAVRFLARHYLEALDDPRHRFVFQGGNCHKNQLRFRVAKQKYRVTHQVVANLPMKSKQNFCYDANGAT